MSRARIPARHEQDPNSSTTEYPRIRCRGRIPATPPQDARVLPDKLYQNQTVTLGRTHRNDIRVRHDSVSRLHCTIDRTVDGRFMISNADAKNGLRVSERGRYSLFRSCSWHILEIGHYVRLGDVTLVAVDANGECPITAQNSTDLIECGMEIYSSKDKLHELLGLPRRLINAIARAMKQQATP